MGVHERDADNLSPLLLAKTAEVLAHPITLLFNQSLRTGQVPQDWRTASITPIFKKGSRAESQNYRPVSLTCILCKVMEKVIRKHIVHHLQENKLISRQQHGFIQGRSCVTQCSQINLEYTTYSNFIT